MKMIPDKQKRIVASEEGTRSCREIFLSFIIFVFASAGCSRSGESNEAYSAGSKQFKGERTAQPVLIESAPDATTQLATRDDKDLGKLNNSADTLMAAPADLRLTAIISDGNDLPRAGFVVEGMRSIMAKPGQRIAGFTVMSIDSNLGQVLLERDGQMYISRIEGDAVATTQEAVHPMAHPEITTLNEAMLSTLPREKFEPTDDEIRRGIDPNNASTWPKDYRGPAIERALRMQVSE